MTHPLFDLSNKTALITGSSQGIGFALAKGLSEAGATIILNGRDTTKLADAAEKLESQGANVYQIPFDVVDHAAVKAAVDGFEKSTGAIDILVNNAGMQFRTPLEDYPEDMFSKLLATNVSSVFNVGQAVARHMIGRKRGKHGLQCNALAPGYFDTPLNAALVADPEFSAWLEKRTPAGRWGKVEELVGACVFLNSAASEFVNGQTIYVDGGITASLYAATALDEAKRSFVVMGVAGCGKSSIGTAVAERLNGGYFEGDDLHPHPISH